MRRISIGVDIYQNQTTIKNNTNFIVNGKLYNCSFRSIRTFKEFSKRDKSYYNTMYYRSYLNDITKSLWFAAPIIRSVNFISRMYTGFVKGKFYGSLY